MGDLIHFKDLLRMCFLLLVSTIGFKYSLQLLISTTDFNYRL